MYMENESMSANDQSCKTAKFDSFFICSCHSLGSIIYVCSFFSRSYE